MPARQMRRYRGGEEQTVSENPPGWYRDPAEPTTQRYWDGDGWVGDSLPIDATPPEGPHQNRRWHPVRSRPDHRRADGPAGRATRRPPVTRRRQAPTRPAIRRRRATSRRPAAAGCASTWHPATAGLAASARCISAAVRAFHRPAPTRHRVAIHTGRACPGLPVRRRCRPARCRPTGRRLGVSARTRDRTVSSWRPCAASTRDRRHLRRPADEHRAQLVSRPPVCTRPARTGVRVHATGRHTAAYRRCHRAEHARRRDPVLGCHLGRLRGPLDRPIRPDPRQMPDRIRVIALEGGPPRRPPRVAPLDADGLRTLLGVCGIGFLIQFVDCLHRPSTGR